MGYEFYLPILHVGLNAINQNFILSKKIYQINYQPRFCSKQKACVNKIGFVTGYFYARFVAQNFDAISSSKQISKRLLQHSHLSII
jgi:hypothetical protein